MKHTAKAAWHEIGGVRYYFRSHWEYCYAEFLNLLLRQGKILKWDHECQTFWFLEIKRGVRSYLPDFKVTYADGTHVWVEVKGFYDAKSLTKIKRFKKYYPTEILQLVDEKWFKANAKTLSFLPGWNEPSIIVKVAKGLETRHLNFQSKARVRISKS